MFRLSALYEGGRLCRALAKKNHDVKETGATLENYFERSEEQYAEARSLVVSLLESLHDDAGESDADESQAYVELQHELAKAKVEILNRLGLVFLDQWKFSSATRQFDNALSEQEKPTFNVGSQGAMTPLAETTPETFQDRMEYIKTRHFQSMALCYTNYLSEAEKNFGEIIDEMSDSWFLQKAGQKTRSSRCAISEPIVLRDAPSALPH